MNFKHYFLGIVSILFLMACGTPKKNLTNIEVRPFEGDIYYKYFNDSLQLTLSLGGGVEIVKNPSVDSIKKALRTSFKYNISNSKINFVDNVLYAKDHFNEDMEYDLIQVYQTKKNLSTQSVLENLKVAQTIPKKNICFSLDSFKRTTFNGKKMYSSKYSIVVGNKFTQVAQCFFEQRGYVIRFLTFGKNLLVCDKDARNFTDSFELSTIKDIDRSKNDVFSASKSFFETKRNYLEPIYQLNHLSDSDKRDGNYIQLFSTYSSYLGDYKNAQKYFLAQFPNDEEKSAIDSNYLNQFSLESALNVVNYIPKDCKVVMINENHFNAYPRVFLKKLLEPLYKKGFTILAGETFSNDSLKEIKELKQGIGFYTSEPNFGEVVRTALNLGFKILPYEKNIDYDSTSKLNRLEFREYQQAFNLKKQIERFPNKKFVVLVGFSHHSKTKRKDNQLMGACFKELTGINPFCIEQATMLEDGSLSRVMPIYNFVQEKYQPKESILFRSSDSFYVSSLGRGGFDVQIFHPRTTYDANGYATWLLNKGDIKKTFAFNDAKYAGTIFQIYEYFEFGRLPFGDAIPILNLPLDGKNTFDITLESGNYYAKVYDRFRNELYTEIFILK